MNILQEHKPTKSNWMSHYYNSDIKLKFASYENYAAYKAKELRDKILPAIKALSNSNLLQQTLDLAGGDDYDGCFTDYGQVIYDELYSELAFRFLGPEEE